MKAVWVDCFAPIDEISMADVPDPTPGPGQVQVAVRAVEANYPDILVIEGLYQVKPPLPFAPGKAAAGTVTALGPDVTTLSSGDHVAVQVEYGAYAEKLVADTTTCYPMPEGMSFEVGAALGLVYQTAHFALVDRAGFEVGETVLVLGASGGIGTASVQLAKALGAATVIAGVLGDANAQVATAAGADHVIDLDMDELHSGVRAAVHEVTDGRGVDIVIDPVGGAANAAALRAMAWCGRMVIIGFASGEIPSIKANYLLVKNISVAGIQWSDYRERQPRRVAKVQEQIFGLWARGLLNPQISQTLPLARFADGLGMLKAGESQGKIILTVP